jgi:hypothetical protein
MPPSVAPTATRPPRRGASVARPVAAATLLSVAGASAQAQIRTQAEFPAGPVGVPAATVPVTDAATGAVEQLLALVPVPGGIVGQRPYATREVTRIAAAVRRELASRDSVRRAVRTGPGELAAGRPAADARAAALAAALLDAYPAAPAPAVTFRPLDFAWLHAVGSGERPRLVPPTNGPGFLDARTLPPHDLRFGRPAVQGAVGSVETAHALGVGGWLALVAQPRASLVVERQPGGGGATTRLRVEPQRLFARAVARNVAVQAGLDEWTWGQGGAGGTFVSAAARPLRAVSVQSDTAFALPGSLRRAGRWRASLFAADLGRDQNFPHATLAAYKVSLAPTPSLEFGAGVMSQFGGRGAPRASVGTRVIDLFPYVGWLDKGSDAQASNKIGAFDVRVRVPRWAGFSAAWEANLDDMDFRRFAGVLRDDAGHLLDVRFARLRADGALALALTAQRTGIRMYEHGQFTSGVTYRDGIVGAPLGPHAQAFGATLTWRPGVFDALSAAAEYEARDPSVYETVTTGADAQGFRFRLVEARPVERRLRLGVTAQRGLPGRGTSLQARLGGERVGNYAFAAGTTITRPFGEAGVRLRF